MKITFGRTVLTGVALVSLFSGCVVRERGHGHVVVRGVVPAPGPVIIRETVVIKEPIGARVVVTHAPPPPPREVVVVSPGPGFVLVPGNWVWQGGWVWHKSHWERPPQPRAVWVPHRHEIHGGGHVWIAGGWRF